MEDKIVFEGLDIEFSDEELEGVDKETLIRCKEKLKGAIKNILNK